MSTLQNTKIKENLSELLFELYDTDTEFQKIIMEASTELLDIYNYDDVDFLDENAGNYLDEYLLDDMLEECQENVPYTLKEVKELALSILNKSESEWEVYNKKEK